MSDSSTSHRKRQLIKQSVTQFCLSTTAHGVSRLAASTDLFRRCVWGIFLLGTYAGFVYHVSTLVVRFTEAPVLTSFTKSHPFEFPDVYICSGSRLSISKLVEPLTQGRLNDLSEPLRCDSSCQKNILQFRARETDLSDSGRALVDSVLAAEKAIVRDEMLRAHGSFNNCRFTLHGEEFTGNVTHVSLYGHHFTNTTSSADYSLKRRFTGTKLCMPWNAAAQLVRTVNPYLGDQLLSHNFSADDRRCRSPPGVSFEIISKEIKSGPLSNKLGCFRKITYKGEQTLLFYQLKDHTDCAASCYRLGFPYMKFQPYVRSAGRVCSCLSHYGNYAKVKDAECNVTCSSGTSVTCANDKKSDTAAVFKATELKYSFKANYRCGILIDIGVVSVAEKFVCFQDLQRPMDCAACCQFNGHRRFAQLSTKCICTDSLLPGLVLEGADCDSVNSYYSWRSLYDKVNNSVVQGEVEQSIRAVYETQLTASLQGPYCFVKEDFTVMAAYCHIPYCETTPNLNCVMSSLPTSAFTGNVSVTQDGKRCELWNTSFQMHMSSVGSVARITLHKSPFAIRNPPAIRFADARDGQAVPLHRLCRAAEILRTDYFFRLTSETPACLVTASDATKVHPDLCDVDSCYDSLPRISASVRHSIGLDLLAQQFAAELPHELVSCRFGGRVCTASDFTSLIHPELGLCHRLQHSSSEISHKDQSRTQLSIDYFADSADSFGFPAPQARKLRDAVFKKQEASVSKAASALQVILVPRGHFPFESHAVRVDAGQRVVLRLRLDRTVRLSRPPDRSCSDGWGKISYNLSTWPADLRQLANFTPTPDWHTAAISDWRMKMEKLRNGIRQQSRPRQEAEMQFTRTQQDCVNSKMVEQILRSCGCTPEFFAIPSSAQRLPRCFSSSDMRQLRDTELCLLQQLRLVTQRQTQFRAECHVPCDTRSFRISQHSHPWPDLKTGQSLQFLEKLAAAYRSPFELRKFRGIGSLHYAHMRAAEVEMAAAGHTAAAEQQQQLVQFSQELQFVNSRMASVTVQAAEPLGEQVTEEFAYPAKNLLADLGGTLGLWSGISVLTLCELIELIVSIVALIRQRNSDAEAEAAAEGVEHWSGQSSDTGGPGDRYADTAAVQSSKL